MGRLLETSAPWKLTVFTFQWPERQEYCIQPDMEAGLLCAGKQETGAGVHSWVSLTYASRRESSGSHQPGRRRRGGCLLYPLSTLVLSFHLSTQSTLVSGRLCHPSPVRSLFDMASSCKHTLGTQDFALLVSCCLVDSVLTA